VATGALDPHGYAIVGMGALSVSVIGGPLTMTFGAEALAVVEAPDNREVIGLLSEAYALRWYSGELEQRRQEILGE
jgi:hypothetical protein